MQLNPDPERRIKQDQTGSFALPPTFVLVILEEKTIIKTTGKKGLDSRPGLMVVQKAT